MTNIDKVSFNNQLTQEPNNLELENNIKNSNIKLQDKIETKTSNGILSKGWYTINNDLYLVKGNSLNTKSRSGNYEPYSEVLASNILNNLNLNTVQYSLMPAKYFSEITSYDINHVSICKSYLKPNEKSYKFLKYINRHIHKGFLNYWDWIHKNNFLSLEFIYTMLISDALIGNEDRHLNNWDIIEDIITDKVYYAPLIDFGASLLSQKTDKELDKIISMSDNNIGYDKAKPFKASHSEHIKLIKKYKKLYNINSLTDLSYETICNRIDYTLNNSDCIFKHLSEKRVYYIKKYINARKKYLEVLL